VSAVFFIAEAGVNHNGDLARGFELVDAAARTGADAVKFQSFDAAELVTPSAPRAEYQKRALGSSGSAEAGDGSQLAMLQKLQLSPGDTLALKRRADERGIAFLSTPFDKGSAELLAGLPVAAFKVGSGELTNCVLLEHLARHRLPLILSTGMATLGDIEQALGWIWRVAPGLQITLLHCTSSYPAPPESANLRAMQTMARAFGLPVGYSDHTLGSEVAIAAVALGATVIEKHLTLDRTLPGPDHQASMEPDEMAALVKAIRNVGLALGDGIKRPTSVEADTARVARRSLVALVDLAAGTRLEASMIGVKRPGTGLSPSLRERVTGMRLGRAVKSGEPLTWESFHE
jgi:N,N'-diacetyllegionaminate synthase